MQDLFSTNGAGSLSPYTQPVTETRSALSLSGGAGGAPQKGAAEVVPVV